MPWAAQSIPRRFCSGTAVINDSSKHPIYYSIAEDTGMIGMDWGVNFCVVGLDRNWAYNPIAARRSRDRAAATNSNARRRPAFVSTDVHENDPCYSSQGRKAASVLSIHSDPKRCS